MSTFKRTVRVTVEKTLEIELTPAVFGGLTEAEYLDAFRRQLWPVRDLGDVACYAAEVGANPALLGQESDGLGLVTDADVDSSKKGAVLIREIERRLTSEVIEG